MMKKKNLVMKFYCETSKIYVTCSSYTVFSIYFDVTMSLLKQQTCNKHDIRNIHKITEVLEHSMGVWWI